MAQGWAALLGSLEVLCPHTLPWGTSPPQPIPCPRLASPGWQSRGGHSPSHGEFTPEDKPWKIPSHPGGRGSLPPFHCPIPGWECSPPPPRRAPSPSPRTTSLTGGLPGGSLGRDGGRGGGGGGVPHVASGVPGRAGDEEPARNGAVSAPQALPPLLPTPEPPGAARGHGTARQMCTEHSRMADARGFLAGDAQCTVLSVKLVSEE